MGEVQHLYRSERIHVTIGVGHFNADSKIVTRQSIVIPPLPPISSTTTQESDIRHTNLYLYSQINYPKNVTWTLGGSGDFLDGAIEDRDQFNPKFGLTWNLFPSTTLRAGLFRTLTRTLISSQTLESTQVAGFNQFFDDTAASESWRYGIAIDQKFPQNLYGGAEFSKRDLELPYFTGTMQVRHVDWEEHLGRAYLFWTPHKWLAASAEYQYERFERDLEFPGIEFIETLETHRLPLGVRLFHPWGFSAGLKATYVHQKGVFVDPLLTTTFRDSDQFWVIDASISYRLPKRWGLITIEAKNLLDEEFKFQDTDPANPQIYPEALISARFTLAF